MLILCEVNPLSLPMGRKGIKQISQVFMLNLRLPRNLDLLILIGNQKESASNNSVLVMHDCLFMPDSRKNLIQFLNYVMTVIQFLLIKLMFLL